MKAKCLILLSVFIFLLSACTTNRPESEPMSLPSLIPSVVSATNTPLPSNTPKPSATVTNVPTPSFTPTQPPAATATIEFVDIVQVLAYLYGGSGFDQELPGTDWDFIRNDSYGSEGACLIYYSPEDDAEENEAALLLCANTATKDYDPIAIIGSFTADWTQIEHSLMYEPHGKVQIAGQETDGSHGTRYLAWLDIDVSSLSVQINFNDPVNASVQEYFDGNVSELIDLAFNKALTDAETAGNLEDSFAPEEQELVDQFGPLLVDETFLQVLFEEDWMLTRYEVDYLRDEPTMPGVCNSHSSALRAVSNCSNLVGDDFELSALEDWWYGSDWERIQPTRELEYETAFFGIFGSGGSWVIQGYLLVDGHLFYASMDGIHIGLGSSIPDTLTGYVNDLLLEILLENAASLANN